MRVSFIAVGNSGVNRDRLIGIKMMGPGLDSLKSCLGRGGGTRKGESWAHSGKRETGLEALVC